MKKILIFIAVLFNSSLVSAQKSDFSYRFYGFVRGDLFYNTRANQAPVDGNFYLYPLDCDLDSKGNDINATPNGSFYTFTTRLGIDMDGPKIGNATSSAKIEVDFGGFFSQYNHVEDPAGVCCVGLATHPTAYRADMASAFRKCRTRCFESFDRSPFPTI